MFRHRSLELGSVLSLSICFTKDAELPLAEPDSSQLETKLTGKWRRLRMQNDRYSTRMDFDLTGELARRLDDIIQRGIVGSKPEAIR